MYSLTHFLWYAKTKIGTWYIWGGDDPGGLDCSGYAVECLKGIGAIGYDEDYTADGLWRKFAKYRHNGHAKEGCLAFWFTGDRATHVAICLDDEFCLTAEGGGSTTHTVEDAANANAFIKLRPIMGARNSEPRFINLFSINTQTIVE